MTEAIVNFLASLVHPSTALVQSIDSREQGWVTQSAPPVLLYYFWGAEGAPILFSEIGFCVASCSYIYIYILYIYIYMYISVKMAAPWGSSTLLSFHLLCLHLRSHLTKWEVLQNTSS